MKRGAPSLGPLCEVCAFRVGFIFGLVLLPPTSAAFYLYGVLRTCFPRPLVAPRTPPTLGL